MKTERKTKFYLSFSEVHLSFGRRNCRRSKVVKNKGIKK